MGLCDFLARLGLSSNSSTSPDEPEERDKFIVRPPEAPKASMPAVSDEDAAMISRPVADYARGCIE